MDILSKFESVKIESTSRITKEDQKYCIAQQSAYEAAKASLQELQFFWDDIVKTQAEILSGTDTHNTTYLTGGDLKLSSEILQENYDTLHTTFVKELVRYFAHKYKIDLDFTMISSKLLPLEPKGLSTYDFDLAAHKDATQNYKQAMQNLSLTYDNILDEIFIYTNGRDLSEQALYELKCKCHNAGWSSVTGKPHFELFKDTLRLTDYACSYDDRYSSDTWTLCSGTKNIIRGLAHFETDSFSYIPEKLLRLLDYFYKISVTEFTGYQKLSQLKLYKNGRVDIKFTSAALAKEFVDNYLDTVNRVL